MKSVQPGTKPKVQVRRSLTTDKSSMGSWLQGQLKLLVTKGIATRSDQ